VTVRTEILHVPMRDGVTLTTRLLRPEGDGPFPLLLARNPYQWYAPDTWIHEPDYHWYAERGYAVALQSIRGQIDSPGEYEFFFGDGEDGYDAIEWLAAQPWCTGRVGMLGGSYLATVQWLAAREHPPHLVCIVPISPAGRMPDELPAQGGAIMPPYLTFGNFAGPHPDAETQTEAFIHHRPLADLDRALGREAPLLREFLEHPLLDDHWRRLRFTPADYAAIELPSFMFAGWFDNDLIGTLEYWAGLNAHTPDEVERHMIVGPWTHNPIWVGGETSLGDLEFGEHARIDTRQLHLDFFDRHLRGLDRPVPPRVRVFVTGANEWREIGHYPPLDACDRRFYLHSGGAANTRHGDGRLSDERPGDEPADRYLFDPENPVRSPAGDLMAVGHRGTDQRYLEERDDVLVYTTDVLDEPVETLGEAFVELHAATDGRDTDFTARLLDVHPDGRAYDLGPRSAGGIIRARYRNGGPEEQLLTPGEIVAYRIDLRHVGHRFLAGHRIRLEISSSYAPLFRPNPNTGNPIATDTEVRIAQQTIHHRATAPSALVLSVVPITREIGT
jgi:putative CocE/NonD family hydrolase